MKVDYNEYAPSARSCPKYWFVFLLRDNNVQRKWRKVVWVTAVIVAVDDSEEDCE